MPALDIACLKQKLATTIDPVVQGKEKERKKAAIVDAMSVI
jgi:hypothetical protein